ncbi:sensor histidine kinase [Aquibacillus saliphilus]|uniref:sensor histidine kinase n=1 Tax=Aquibacillus saliphilus TaxID=1909422 RepID=UPI001CF05D1B|nr:HAMP domain-containing sensor histidine kinase [Aquibacillus saliphilus]
MKITLRSKILFYILIVSLSGVFLTSFTIFFGVDNQFADYLEKNRENNRDQIEKVAIQQYDETGTLVNDQLINLMREQAMTDNLFYKIYDENKNLVVDTTNMQGMMGMMREMHSQTLSATDYQSVSHDIILNKKSIGSMKVYFPVELMGEDFIFLKSIKQNIVIAVIVTVILSILFSLLFSKRLTKGFNQLSKAIQDLRNHKRLVRVPINELTDEMKPLGESFNQLAESVFKEEELRKQFTADFAHELRTPLATLQSQIEAYQDEIWEPTPKRLKQSHDELMRLVRLVNELEKLIAAENPQIKFKKTNLEAGQLISLIEDQFRPIFKEKGVDLNIQNIEEKHWFKGNHDKVIQILTNIVNNALQYTPLGKKVTIDIEDKIDYISFIVKDEGVGISEKDLPHLFERFYRGDKSRDRKTGGIGIGLSIAKALVEAHQGKIEVESQLSVGTTFEVLFPKQ